MPQPRHRLVKSTLFSAAVHGLLVVPIASMSGLTFAVHTDVTRGFSSVELELVAPSSQRAISDDGAGNKQGKSASAAGGRQEAWVNDGGAAMRQSPSSLQNPAPRYPWEARVHGWHGTVFLEALVMPSGQAASVRVVRSSGHPPLDGAALAALRQWRFIPARRGTQMVASRVEIPITFKLERSSEGGENQ